MQGRTVSFETNSVVMTSNLGNANNLAAKSF